MHVVVTNINPYPLKPFEPIVVAGWWTSCVSCEAIDAEHPTPWCVEAENEQQAIDYAMGHWRLSHHGEVMEFTIETQLSFNIPAEVTP